MLHFALKVQINHSKTIKIKILAKMIRKSKSCQIYLKIFIPANLEAMSTSLTLIFQDFISEIYF